MRVRSAWKARALGYFHERAITRATRRGEAKDTHREVIKLKFTRREPEQAHQSGQPFSPLAFLTYGAIGSVCLFPNEIEEVFKKGACKGVGPHAEGVIITPLD